MVNKNMVALANEDSNDKESIREEMYAPWTTFDGTKLRKTKFTTSNNTNNGLVWYTN